MSLTLPPFIELSSSSAKTKPNIIRISFQSSDLIYERWIDRLKEACKTLSLTLLLPHLNSIESLAELSELPWNRVECVTHETYLTNQTNIAQKALWNDSTSEEDSFDESNDSFDDSWEQSELQEWLMSSLHEQEAEPELCIIYGGAPRLIVEWLRQKLESSFNIEIDLQKALDSDDLDIIIEFSPLFNFSSYVQHQRPPHIHHKTASYVLPPNQATLISAPQSLIEKQKADESNESSIRSSDLWAINRNTNHLHWKELQFLVRPYSDETYQLAVQAMKYFEHFSYRTQVFEQVLRQLYYGTSMFIAGINQVGLSDLIVKLAQVMNSSFLDAKKLIKLTESRFDRELKTKLSWVKSSAMPTLFIKDYDLFTSEQKAKIVRGLMSLDASVKETQMVLSLTQMSSLTHLSELHEFTHIPLPRFSIQDWKQTLSVLLTQKLFPDIEASDTQNMSIQDSQLLIKLLDWIDNFDVNHVEHKLSFQLAEKFSTHLFDLSKNQEIGSLLMLVNEHLSALFNQLVTELDPKQHPNDMN